MTLFFQAIRPTVRNIKSIERRKKNQKRKGHWQDVVFFILIPFEYAYTTATPHSQHKSKKKKKEQ
jgi:hypothetical protein